MSRYCWATAMERSAQRAPTRTRSAPPRSSPWRWPISTATTSSTWLSAATARPAVLPGNGDGTFDAPRALGPLAGALTIADFNADGKPDLASTWDSVSVLLGNGDGSFQTAGSLPACGSGDAADVNGDRALDLVLGGGSVLLGIGDGHFGPPITTAVVGSSLVVADFNGEGRPDEALTDTKSTSDRHGAA